MARLVTLFGGGGFLGRSTVRALAKAGWRIRVACRRPNQALFLRTAGHVGQIDLVKCDITNPDQVAAALIGADAAVNLVGLLYGAFEEAHVVGAETIAKAAAAAGLKALVHVSAIGADVDSHAAYAMTKGEGENRVRAAFPAATILQPSIIFGPEDRFFNKFASLARFLPALPLIGGGKTRFQPVFVGDVAAAILAALEKEAARGKTYELCGPTTYTFRELMEVTLATIHRRRLLVPVPFLLAKVKAFFLQLAPRPMLTPDQVELLKSDNVSTPGALGLSDLDIAPTTVEAEVGAYLWRYRPKGEYADLGRISPEASK